MTRTSTGGTNRLATTRLTVANRHSGLEITSFPPFADTDTLAEAVKGLQISQTVLKSKAGQPNLWGCGPMDMMERSAVMTVAKHMGEPVATLQSYRSGENDLWFTTAAALPHYGGMKIASAMVCAATLYDSVLYTEMPNELIAAVREKEDGTLNEPSKRSFTKLGFLLEVESGQTYLKGTYRDRHLFHSAEINEEGEAFIRYRRLVGDPDQVLKIAKVFLAEWSEMILPFPKSPMLL